MGVATVLIVWHGDGDRFQDDGMGYLFRTGTSHCILSEHRAHSALAGVFILLWTAYVSHENIEKISISFAGGVWCVMVLYETNEEVPWEQMPYFVAERP